MSLSPRIIILGNQNLAQTHIKLGLRSLENLGVRMQPGEETKSRVEYLSDGTMIKTSIIYGEKKLIIDAPYFIEPEEAEKEREVHVEGFGRYVFYAITGSGPCWVQFYIDEHTGEKSVQAFPMLSYDVEKYSIVMADGSSALKSIYSGANRYLATDTGLILDNKYDVFHPSIGSGSQIQIQDDFVCMYKVLDNGSSISGNIFKRIDSTLKLQKNFVFNESDIKTDDLLEMPSNIHMKCFGSYFEPQKTIGFLMDTGYELPPSGLRPHRNGLGNQVDNGVEDGLWNIVEYYFNLIEDMRRMSAIFCGMINIDPESLEGILMTKTRDKWFDDANSLPWGGWGHSEFGGIGFDVEEKWLSPRFITTDGLEVFSKSKKLLGADDCIDGPALIASVTQDMRCKSSDPDIKKHGPKDPLSPPSDWECEGDCTYTDESVRDCGFGLSYSEKESLNKFMVTGKQYDKEFLSNEKIYRIEALNSKHETEQMPIGLSRVIPYGNDLYSIYFKAGFNKQTGLLYGKRWSSACFLCGPNSMGPNQVATFYVGGGVCSVDTAKLNTDLYIEEDLYYRASDGALVCELRMPDLTDNTKEWNVSITCFDPDGQWIECSQTVICGPCCICSEESILRWSAEVPSDLLLGRTYKLKICGGCAPFTWTVNGDIGFSNTEKKDIETSSRSQVVYCKDSGSVTVTDNCGNSESITCRTCYVTGPDNGFIGEILVYDDGVGNKGNYIGSLQFISQSSEGYVVTIPESACGVLQFAIQYGSTICSKTVRVIDGGHWAYKSNTCGAAIKSSVVHGYTGYSRYGAYYFQGISGNQYQYELLYVSHRCTYWTTCMTLFNKCNPCYEVYGHPCEGDGVMYPERWPYTSCANGIFDGGKCGHFAEISDSHLLAFGTVVLKYYEWECDN